MLGTHCPNALYPYARQAIGDLIQGGGFPPFLLQPINFESLYAETLRQRSQQAQDGAGLADAEAAGNACSDMALGMQSDGAQARPVTVLGAGSWGTALAALIARHGHPTVLWGRDAAVVEAIAARHENPRYLAGVPLPGS